MDDNLKQATNPDEQVTEPTSEEKQVTEPTPTEVEPTSQVEPTPITFTQEQQEQIDKMVAKGKGEVQSAFMKKLKERDEREAQKDREHQEALLADEEKRELAELDEAGVPRDTIKDFQNKRRKFFEERSVFEGKRAEVEELAERVSLTNKSLKAKELAQEYGVNVKELLECETEEEMERKALKLGYTSIQSKLKQAKTVPQKIDSSTLNAAGIDLSSMSSDEKIKLGLTKK